MDISRWGLGLIAGLYGLVIGSAINAVVWRLYVGRSWAKGRSECPDCHHKLAAKDLVPVLSWVSLRGKCRYCKKSIHYQYPLVELFTAGLFALSAWRLMPVGTWGYGLFIGWLGLLIGFIILAVYDARWMILPDKVVLPLVAGALIYCVANGWYSEGAATVGTGWPVVILGLMAVGGLVAWSRIDYDGRWANILVAVAYVLLLAALGLAYSQGELRSVSGPLLAALGASFGFFIIAWATGGRGMGGGDVKLVFAIGLLLGLGATLVALELAFVAGAAVGIGLMIRRRRRLGMQLPFGPFLIIGLIVAFLYGRDIIQAYLHWNG